jgi:hypothetical protein
VAGCHPLILRDGGVIGLPLEPGKAIDQASWLVGQPHAFEECAPKALPGRAAVLAQVVRSSEMLATSGGNPG